MFDHLAQYASYHVDSKEKKSDCFLRGLNLRMQDKLSTSLDSMPDYSCAVSLALTTEAKMVALEASLKRKDAPEVSNPGAAQRTRVVYRIRLGPIIVLLSSSNNHGYSAESYLWSIICCSANATELTPSYTVWPTTLLKLWQA